MLKRRYFKPGGEKKGSSDIFEQRVESHIQAVADKKTSEDESDAKGK